jgi:hypothetical protein
MDLNVVQGCGTAVGGSIVDRSDINGIFKINIFVSEGVFL